MTDIVSMEGGGEFAMACVVLSSFVQMKSSCRTLEAASAADKTRTHYQNHSNIMTAATTKNCLLLGHDNERQWRDIII
jgi:hypothetical protein